MEYPLLDRFRVIYVCVLNIFRWPSIILYYSSDEAGIAAYKSVELDDFLGINHLLDFCLVLIVIN